MSRASCRFLLPLACVFALAACQPRAVDTSADKAALAAIADGWETAYNDKNADGVAALYADDAIVMPPDTPAVAGKAAIKGYFDDDIGNHWAKLSVKAEASEVSGDWGWRSGTWSAVDSPGVSGKYIEVWHRSAGAWKLHRDIWNADSVAPPPAPEPAAAAPAAK